MIPGGVELVVIAVLVVVLLAGPRLVPAAIDRTVETAEATRAAVDGALVGEADETEDGR